MRSSPSQVLARRSWLRRKSVVTLFTSMVTWECLTATLVSTMSSVQVVDTHTTLDMGLFNRTLSSRVSIMVSVWRDDDDFQYRVSFPTDTSRTTLDGWSLLFGGLAGQISATAGNLWSFVPPSDPSKFYRSTVQ